jgi:glutaredoxin
MKNIKKSPILIIIILAIIILGGLFWTLQKPKMILFYGNSCPHCQIVEKYINDNGIRNKFKFQELEVSQDQANAALLERKARGCGLDTAQGLNVPFFFDGNKCLVGDQDIINYFQK